MGQNGSKEIKSSTHDKPVLQTRNKSEAGSLPGLLPISSYKSIEPATPENSPHSANQDDKEMQSVPQVTRPAMPRQITRLSNIVDPAELRENTMVKSPSGNLLGSQEFLERLDRPLSLRERQDMIRRNMAMHMSNESINEMSVASFQRSPSKLSDGSTSLETEPGGEQDIKDSVALSLEPNDDDDGDMKKEVVIPTAVNEETTPDGMNGNDEIKMEEKPPKHKHRLCHLFCF